MYNGRIDYNPLDGSYGNGCGPAMLMYGIIIALVICLASCRSTKEFETTNENHKVSELVDRMDSLFRSTSAWQQDIYSKQSSLIDSIKERERNDSSHTVVINEKGDTIKETIIIERYIEKEHSSEKEESEMWMHRFEKVDSMLRVAVDRQERTDSLLREYEKVMEKQLTKWQQFCVDYGGIALIVLFILIIIGLCWFIRKVLPRWQ